MRRRRTNLALLLGLCACHQQVESTRTGAAFIQVSLDAAQVTGSPEAPLAFSSEESLVGITFEMLDSAGASLDFSGTVELSVRPGELTGNPYVTISNGKWSGDVGIKNGFGPTRIWVTDSGALNSETGPSYATGVTEPIYYQIPTIGEMNRIDDHESNQLEKEFAEIRAFDRDIRVTSVGTSGFWVMDMDDEAGQHNSLFIYTFSKPEDEVEEGRRISLLTGNNQEYLATTQISFPTYDVAEDAAITMPGPSVLPSSMCGATDILEGYESGLVKLENVQVPTGFGSSLSDKDYQDYLSYGQWPVTHGSGCTFYVNSAVQCPDFVPTDSLALSHVTGMLSEVWDKWILNIRSPEDLPPGICGESGVPSGPNLPRPREDR